MHSGEKSNKCNQCNYASFHAGDLRTHLKTHSGEKPNKCNQCDYATSQAAPWSWAHCKCAGLGSRSVCILEVFWAFFCDSTFLRRCKKSQTLPFSEMAKEDAARFFKWLSMTLRDFSNHLCSKPNGWQKQSTVRTDFDIFLRIIWGLSLPNIG